MVWVMFQCVLLARLLLDNDFLETVNPFSISRELHK